MLHTSEYKGLFIFSRPAFLNLDTIDILIWIILCYGGLTVFGWMFNIPPRCQKNDTITPSCDNRKCL